MKLQSAPLPVMTAAVQQNSHVRNGEIMRKIKQN